MNWFTKKKETGMPVVVHSPEDRVLSAIVENLAKEIVGRNKQDLLAETEGKLKQVLQKYKATISRQAYLNAQAWCKWSDEGPVLMPDYARTYYRKGDTEVLLLEFQPQIRSLKFAGALVGKDGGRVFTYSLSLPYTVFIFKFKDGKFEQVLHFFSSKAVKKLTEKPCKPMLPNLDNGCKVCLGSSFNQSELEIGNITQQASLVLHHFWHSTFTAEWNYFWEPYKQHFSGDPRMKDLNSWQEATTEDPLFVNDVNWMPHNEEYGDIFVRLFEGDRDAAKFQQEFFTSTSEAILEDLEKEIAKMFESFDHKKNLEHHTKTLAKALKDANPGKRLDLSS